MSDVNGRLAASLSGCAALLRAVTCAFRTPANGRRAVRRNAVSRPRVSSLRRVPAHSLPGFFTPLSPFAGAETSTTRLAVHALLAHGHKNFLPEPAKTFHVRHGRLHRAVLVYALAANGSQTGEGYIQGAGSAGPRKTSKPRPRQLNG